MSYSVNGTQLFMDVVPEIVNGRAMVPLRYVSEGLGATVMWNEATKTVTIYLDGETLRVTIGQLDPGMDVPAHITAGRTMIPLRYVTETLGCEVDWNPDTRVITITKIF